IFRRLLTKYWIFGSEKRFLRNRYQIAKARQAIPFMKDLLLLTARREFTTSWAERSKIWFAASRLCRGIRSIAKEDGIRMASPLSFRSKSCWVSQRMISAGKYR